MKQLRPCVPRPSQGPMSWAPLKTDEDELEALIDKRCIEEALLDVLVAEDM